MLDLRAFATPRPARVRDQAARIFVMKRASSSRSRLLSVESERAESSTFSDAEPVSAEHAGVRDGS